MKYSDINYVFKLPEAGCYMFVLYPYSDTLMTESWRHSRMLNEHQIETIRKHFKPVKAQPVQEE